MTDQLVLDVGYDVENFADPARRRAYVGAVTTDPYGRILPKSAHGTATLGCFTSSTRKIVDAAMACFDEIVNAGLLARRVNLTANHLTEEGKAGAPCAFEQLDLFTDYAAEQAKRAKEQVELEREKRVQHAMLSIKKRFGKNALVKGFNLLEGATAMERNSQIGGHKA